MKRLAVIPLLASLALTGCSQTSGEGDGNSYDSFGITPEIHQELTPQENELLDAGKNQVKVGKDVLTFTPAVVTDSDGKNKNGDFVQGKHVRIAFDTGNLPYHCADEEHWETTPYPETPGENGNPDCISTVSVVSSPALDTPYGEGDERAGISDMFVHGRNVIEFDTMSGEAVRVKFDMGSGKYTTFDAHSGKLITNEVMEELKKYDAKLTPGATATVTEALHDVKPQYVRKDYNARVGKTTITKDKDGRSVLTAPLAMKLSGADCAVETVKDCHVVGVEVLKNGKHINPSESAIVTPTDFAGTLTVHSPAFDEAYLHIREKFGTNGDLNTKIDLLSGKVVYSKSSAELAKDKPATK